MASSEYVEQRRLRRFVVNAQVYDVKTGALLGYTANMHTEGMMVKSVQPIPVADEFKLLLEYLDDADDLAAFTLRALCLWCQPSSNPDFFTSGFRFIDLTGDQTEAVERMIRTLQVHD